MDDKARPPTLHFKSQQQTSHIGTTLTWSAGSWVWCEIATLLAVRMSPCVRTLEMGPGARSLLDTSPSSVKAIEDFALLPANRFALSKEPGAEAGAGEPCETKLDGSNGDAALTGVGPPNVTDDAVF